MLFSFHVLIGHFCSFLFRSQSLQLSFILDFSNLSLLFFLNSLAKGMSILLLLKNPTFGSAGFSLISYPRHISLIISCLLFPLGLICCSFYSFLKQMVRLLISDCSRYNKFPSKNCFSCIPFILVCFFFFFSFTYFLVSIVISSLTHWVFRSVVSFPDIYFKWVIFNGSLLCMGFLQFQ